MEMSLITLIVFVCKTKFYFLPGIILLKDNFDALIHDFEIIFQNFLLHLRKFFIYHINTASNSIQDP